jgi:hypothetical protein
LITLPKKVDHCAERGGHFVQRSRSIRSKTSITFPKKAFPFKVDHFPKKVAQSEVKSGSLCPKKSITLPSTLDHFDPKKWMTLPEKG